MRLLACEEKAVCLRASPRIVSKWDSRSLLRADAVGGLEYEDVKGFITHVKCILGEPVKKLLKD